MKKWLFITAGIALGIVAAEVSCGVESFYRQPPLFNFTHAKETVAKQSIEKFGPVGMSIELRLPPFQMYVGKIEEGSPAASTGKLKTGQKIESINGQVLKDIDPRIQLARIITDAEAKDGKITFMVRDDEKSASHSVVVRIPVLGAYSPTWPLNCKKSDSIVRNLAAYIKKNGRYDLDTKGWASFNGFGMLFMLSTGEKEDLDVVRGWLEPVFEQYRDAEHIKLLPWAYGPGALPLAEYYLRTGDKRMLPILKHIADQAARTMYSSGWSGRGRNAFGYVGQGHMNAAGVHVCTFLLLAKECGVDVDEKTLHEALRHFYKYSGKGSLPYGDHFPETYFIDNGKTGALAFTMAAAASLTPDGEKSVYAKARDISAMRGFYGCNYMLIGHTGGGIGEAWRGPAMGFLQEKEPKKYRAFMDGRQWHLEMSRRFNGSFSMLNHGGPYGSPDTWGHMMGLQYTVPRKTLRMTGAPRTRWSKPYQLPVRIWGTLEDDDFCEIKPATDFKGKVPAFDDTLEGGTINGIERMFRAAEDTSALALKHCLHPDHEVRREIGAGYTKGNALDSQTVLMLKHKDARVRRVGLSVIHSVHKGTHVIPPERLTEEMMDLVIKMVNDPNESWWVVENALRAMSIIPVEKTAPHIDRLLYWLGHDEWWMRHSAIVALVPLAADARNYSRIMPKMGEAIAHNSRAGVTAALSQLAARLKAADAKVQVAAAHMLSKAYADFPTELSDVGGLNPNKPMNGLLNGIADKLRAFPGGFEALFEVSRKRFPDQALPHKQYYLWADTSTFSPKLRKEVGKVFREEVIPEYIARNLGALRAEVKRERGGDPKSALDGLANLYGKAGMTDYAWHNYGPDRNAMTWHYYMTEKPAKGKNIVLPAETKHWNKPAFDPAKAGWKQGQAPFGHVKDEALTRWSCKNPVCRCADPIKTIWDKGSLLLTATFTFPAMKDGYSYRLLFGGVNHVGISGRAAAFINGRQVASAGGGVRRGHGGRPCGSLIPGSFDAVFQGQEVTISASAQPRKQKRGRVAGNFMAVWMEEMKNPPFSDAQAWKGLETIAMQSSAWQQDQKSDVPEVSSSEGLYHFDGTFVPNGKVLGSWTPLGQVPTVDAFKLGDEIDPAGPRYKSITFRENGFTDSTTRYWSGDTLMEGIADRTQAMALKMKTKTIDGTEYLFIETGGFTFSQDRQTYKQPRTWQSPWYVLKK